MCQPYIESATALSDIASNFQMIQMSSIALLLEFVGAYSQLQRTPRISSNSRSIFSVNQ